MLPRSNVRGPAQAHRGEREKDVGGEKKTFIKPSLEEREQVGSEGKQALHSCRGSTGSRVEDGSQKRMDSCE